MKRCLLTSASWIHGGVVLVTMLYACTHDRTIVSTGPDLTPLCGVQANNDNGLVYNLVHGGSDALFTGAP